MQQVTFYQIEDIWIMVIKAINLHEGTLDDTCHILGINKDLFSKMRRRIINIPFCIIKKMGLHKVVDDKQLIGYVGEANIDGLWSE